jgi:hypothetical protein
VAENNALNNQNKQLSNEKADQSAALAENGGFL